MQKPSQFHPEGVTQDEMIQRLSAYIDPNIINEIFHGNSRPDGGVEAEDVALLFADIRGFTALSQDITPTQLISILNKFLDMTAQCIHRHKGIIDKFMGDCTMAYWRVKEEPDALYYACRAALEIQRDAQEFSAHVLRLTGHQIGIGIGINAGPALVCHVGNREYMAYTVVGSTVNIASRLEEYARAGSIYISASAASQMGDSIITEPTQQFQRRRGRDVAVPMVRLIGLAERPAQEMKEEQE